MRRAAPRQFDLTQGRLNCSNQISVADRASPQRHPAGDAMAGQLPAGGGDGHPLHLDSGHILRPLHGLGDSVGGFVQIDNRAVPHAA